MQRRWVKYYGRPFNRVLVHTSVSCIRCFSPCDEPLCQVDGEGRIYMAGDDQTARIWAIEMMFPSDKTFTFQVRYYDDETLITTVRHECRRRHFGSLSYTCVSAIRTLSQTCYAQYWDKVNPSHTRENSWKKWDCVSAMGCAVDEKCLLGQTCNPYPVSWLNHVTVPFI